MCLEIRPARSPEDLDRIGSLRHRVFADEGRFYPTRSDGRVLDAFDEVPTSLNLGAYRENKLIASVRVTRDDPAYGLPTDSHFDFRSRPEINPTGLVAASHLCCDPKARGRIGVLHAMMRVAYLWVMDHQGVSVIAAFNPAIQRMMTRLSFHALPDGPCRSAAMGAEIVPMVAPITGFSDHIASLYWSRDQGQAESYHWLFAAPGERLHAPEGTTIEVQGKPASTVRQTNAEALAHHRWLGQAVEARVRPVNAHLAAIGVA